MHTIFRLGPVRPDRGTRRGLRGIVATACTIVAIATLALPSLLDATGLVAGSALAASENSNAGGNGRGKGPEGAPGQQAPEDLAGTDGDTDVDVEAAATEGGGTVREPATIPIPEDAHTGVNVIKEIAGLEGEAELSEEEELEAIRSGWGTWRTADGPETVIAQ